MSRAVHREVPKTTKSANRRLAFGVFAAPVAWTVHEMVAVALVGRTCQLGDELSNWQWTALTVLTVLAAILALAGLLTAYGAFRRWGRETGKRERLTRAEGWDRVQFVALTGVFVSAILLLNIIYFGVMPMIVEPCLRVI